MLVVTYTEMDLIPWALTVVVSLFVGLEYGIAIGLITSAMFLLYYAARPRVKLLQGFVSYWLTIML